MEVNNNNEINKMFGETAEPTPPQAVPVSEPAPAPAPAEPAPVAEVPQQASPPASFSPSFSDMDDREDEVIEGDEFSFGFASPAAIKKAKKASNPKMASLKLFLVLLPLILIIGVSGGAFLCYLHFFGLDILQVNNAVVNAADAVIEYTKENYNEDSNVIFYNIYVKNKTEEYEYIVFCAVETSPTVYEATAFRIIIDKGDGYVDIYPEFNEAEYARLNSGTDNEKVHASVMLRHKNEFDRCSLEIQEGETDWKRFDADALALRMKQNQGTFWR
ncbi:MAG: hypothetical protein FWD34_05145 [Oscillospiraceae bacterium]|nr:hypothetical protein [Oscillospiraceae bacterium]